jgi:hypothetical protein
MSSDKDVKTIRWLHESPLWHEVKVCDVKPYNADKRRGFYYWTDVHQVWLKKHFDWNFTTTEGLVVPYKGRDKKVLYELRAKDGFKRFWFKDPAMAMLFKLTF